ncbi:enolase C-terminal domain-like protein [Bradyrhizobium sp. KB893862 SZCCT0404]|uniref:enolase C-terminal domain-like protein n=1 Tax=Bradyrhizobium sp. KB893862 SZCCT0404 TaxID=2807672 RepID=UPI0020126702|nr:enolase C-terminal domain-like protein [Bradyrhizobium sp. KB893862 SZCCT0404]
MHAGGITPFLQILALADHKKLQLAPHYCMEIHLHLTAAYVREHWVEHFEWSEAMFNEKREVVNGCMIVPNQPASASACRNMRAPGFATSMRSESALEGEWPYTSQRRSCTRSIPRSYAG